MKKWVAASLVVVAGMLVMIGSAGSRPLPLSTPDQVASATFPKLHEFWKASFEAGGLSGFRSPKFYWWYNKAGASGWVPVAKNCDAYGVADGRMWRGKDKAYSPNSFYCATNQQIYLDHSFLTTLGFRVTRKWGRGDDGRVALVIAHEFAHHVQKLLGWNGRRTNNYARYELHADCYAGVFFAWGERNGLMERGDTNQATVLLGYLGDPDGTPWSEPQAHGGHNDRQEWFTYGYETEQPQDCDKIWR
jgi:Putative neutral zinc metallopeptidase